MQKNFIHFLSKDMCLVDINGKNIGSIDNINNLELDIVTNCENVYVTYTPISTKQCIPYSFLLNTKTKVTCENEYIEVIPFPNNHYDIIMKPFYYYQINNSQILLNTMVGKFFVSVITENTSKITIHDGNNIVFNLNTVKLKSVRSEIKKDILIIEGVVDEDSYYLLLINTKNFEIIHNDIINSIEKTNETITSYKPLKDISNHAEIFTFDYEKAVKDIYHVYENNTPKQPLSNLLIPMTFIEAIKIKDDTLAQHYLHENHQNTPIQKFRDYLGNINKCFLNRHDILDDKLNYTISTHDRYKNYNFIMEDNKIKDIEEIF